MVNKKADTWVQDHTKKTFLDIYKMDLAETMKQVLSNKGTTLGGANMPGAGSMHNQPNDANPSNVAGVGYVTEKLYMLLQLYLQNKGWSPSVELLQCFSELKDSALLPSAAYLQVLANRLALDSQGRLVLRESGKIVLPYEHFANAVMLKHMTGPHGLHLSVEATVRAVIDSYTIGRENFGMEKEFIIEVVQSCPNPACRYYKNHLGVGPPFMDTAFQAVATQINPDFMQHLPQMAAAADMTQLDINSISVKQQQQSQRHAKALLMQQSSNQLSPKLHLCQQQHQVSQQNLQMMQTQQQQQNQHSVVQAQAQAHHAQQAQQQQQQQQHHAQQQQQQQITAAIIQQQNRAIAQQKLEKFGNMSPMEKHRVLQQLDKKHYDIPQHQVSHTSSHSSSMASSPSTSLTPTNLIQQTHTDRIASHDQRPPLSMTVQHKNSLQPHLPPPPSPMPQVDQHKVSDILRSSNIDSIESLASNKDLLSLHNGAWGGQDSQNAAAGQEKIIRAFGELMRNMARMKTYIRPSMCKPYGKQSESLQKTLIDTIQLVQSLRSCLPAPHIPVSSWKSEDRHL